MRALKMMDLRNAKKGNNAVEINDLNLDNVGKYKDLLENPIYWHKISIEDVYGLKRNDLFNLLMERALPFDLIPLQYQAEAKGGSFFARTCANALEKFLAEKLIIENPLDKNKPFKLKIIFAYTSIEEVKVDLAKNIVPVLKKRYDKETGVLCLNDFSKDPDLEEFIAFVQPKLFAFVLNLARNMFTINAIALCNNDITNLEPMKILSGQNIICVDLRNNLIRDLGELVNLRQLHIIDIWLEGNPLCALYDEFSYAQTVFQYCRDLQKLDGFLLRQNGFPSFRRNFMCKLAARDLVDNFLEQYFTTYDSKNLLKLESLYHKESMFTLTSDITDETSAYRTSARNLINLNNNSNTTNLYSGRNEVLKVLSSLPRCEHDPYSFTVDVLRYSTKSIVIVVTGVFREIPISDEQKLFGFNRHFVVTHANNANYKIVNEQFHVFNALTSQQLNAFKVKRPKIILRPMNSQQEAQLIDTLAIITNLSKDWSRIFLEECQFNLKKAVQLFVKLYKSDKIPPEGFNNFN